MPLQPSQLPQRAPSQVAAFSAQPFVFQTPPRTRTDDDIRYVCIQHDVLLWPAQQHHCSRMPVSLVSATNQREELIISCLAALSWMVLNLSAGD